MYDSVDIESKNCETVHVHNYWSQPPQKKKKKKRRGNFCVCVCKETYRSHSLNT